MKEYKFKINGNEYNVAINGIEGQSASVCVNGVEYSVELDAEALSGAGELAPRGASLRFGPTASGSPSYDAEGGTSPRSNSPAAAPAGTPAGGKVIKSPLPGVIIGLEAREGLAVKKGQRLAVLEAMKMENDILAECDGTIAAVHVGKGDSVLEGAAIVTIA